MSLHAQNRHYGLLANPNGAKLAQAKAALHMPAPNPMALLSAQDFMARVARVNSHQCPVCQQGRMGVVQTLALGGTARLRPLPGLARRGGGSATDRHCGPKKASAGAQSSHNDFLWRGLKPSTPYSVDFHTTAFAAA